MGSTEQAGHLLCTIPFPEPGEVLDRIRRNFPSLKITYQTSHLAVDWEKDSGLPEDVWKDVTVLCTLSQFPPHPSAAPKLEMIHIVSAGTNHMWDLPIYRESTVPITTSSGIHAPAIAEWVMMMTLAASRKYDTLREWHREHLWDESQGGKAMFQSVSDNVGKRLGILGYGSIGRQVGALARAMGMEVVVFTATPRTTSSSRRDQGYCVPGTGDPEGTIPRAWHSGYDTKSLHEFLGQDLDQLLVSVPLSKSTTHLLGKREFDILAKKNAFLINVARGEVLVQKDLIEALELYHSHATGSNGRRLGLRGAALDVTVPEPLTKDDPLWEAPNCIVTPHMSCISQQFSSRALDILATNLERRAHGQRLLNLVDRDTGYASIVHE